VRFFAQLRTRTLNARTLRVAALFVLLVGVIPTQQFKWEAHSHGTAVRNWQLGLSSPVISLHQTGVGPLTDIRWHPPQLAVHPVSWSALLVVLGIVLGWWALAIRGLARKRISRNPASHS
jgi:hypothetical protein